MITSINIQSRKTKCKQVPATFEKNTKQEDSDNTEDEDNSLQTW